MLTLRSILFHIAFWVWSAVINLAWLPSLLMPPLATVRGQTWWAMGVMWLLRVIAGTRIDIRGRERIPPGAVLMAAKHQSAWDTIIFHIITHDPAIVMKRELLHIPIYGWYCRHSRMIPVDRAAGSKALRDMVEAAQAAKAAARPIIIFPQGTRIAPGVAAPYLPGVAALYNQLEIPCVPIALNSGLFWPRRGFLRRPGTIVLEFLEPIPAGLQRRAFMVALEDRIEAGTARLVTEGRADPAPG